ncbi:MAG: hypothetical protein HRU36_02410 [Rickettsiales bacterium]|nr:hypothetical protein [Rickettsiales bacterium]
MFWLITDAGKWSASLNKIATSISQVKLISAYNFQNLKTSLQFFKKLKLGAAKSGLKWVLTHKKLPQTPKVFNPISQKVNTIYQNVRWNVVKISKPLKDIVMSKKVSAALSALGTAAVATQLGVTGLPIILLPLASAIGTYAREKRQEKAIHDVQRLENNLMNAHGYDQKLSSVSFTTPTKKTTLEKELPSYTPPSPTEIVKAGIDITLSGLVCGVASISFISTVAPYAYSVYSEIKQSYKIHSLKSQLKKTQKLQKPQKPQKQKWTDKIKSSRKHSSSRRI